MGVDDDWPDADDIVFTVCGVGRAGGDKIKGDPEGVFNEAATEIPPPLPGTARLLSSPDDITLALLGVDIIALETKRVWIAASYVCIDRMLFTVANFEVMLISRREKCRQCLNDHVVFSSKG